MAHDNTPLGILVHDLSFQYEGEYLFKNLSFQISPGSFTGVLGKSGIGKSSLLKIIAGLIKPDHGFVQGTSGASLLNQIAYMGQQDLLFPWLNISENVCLGAKLRGEVADEKRALNLIRKVGLYNARNQYPASLSGGMRQRAAIARTLYEERPIVLMDEPFSALDAVTRSNIQELAYDVLRDKTVLIVTHDPAEAARLCDTILVLEGQPAQFHAPLRVVGTPPRPLNDPHFIATETQLMHILKAASHEG